MPARSALRLNLAFVGAIALVIAIANPAAAPPGDLDPTFHGDGRVTTDFGGNNDGAHGLAIQGNGKIVAAGWATPASEDFGLARYNTDGSLDNTFDGDGLLTTDFITDGTGDRARAVAIQADGKIVAVGCANCSSATEVFALARYNTDGTLDTSFDGDGKVTSDLFSDAERAFALVIQSDGRIVVAGHAIVSGTDDFVLARYNTDGSIDATFDGDGVVTTDFAGSTDQAFAVSIQADGKIVAAGCAICSFSSVHDFALARYNSDGSLDTTFDGDGKATTDFAGSFDEAKAVAIQGDGKIVAAGWAGVSATLDFALARYNSDGSLDTAFSGDGKVTTDFADDSDSLYALSLQADKKIVAAGSVGRDFGLARYNGNGSLDNTFSGDGKVTTDFAGDVDIAFAVSLQVDKKIVAAGVAFSGTGDFALARYTCLRRTSRQMSIPLCS